MQTAIPRDGASEGAPAGAGQRATRRCWTWGIGARLAELPSRGPGRGSLGCRRSSRHRGQCVHLHRSAPSITREIVAEQPPPLPTPSHAALTLNSDSRGRGGDASQRRTVAGHHAARRHPPCQWQQITYRFRLAGYTDVQMPFPGQHGRQLRRQGEPRTEAARAQPFRLARLSRKTSRGKLRKGEPELDQRPRCPCPHQWRSRTTTRHRHPTLPPLNPSVRVRRIGGR